MFNVNDTVVYGQSELCVIKDIKVPEFIKSNEEYYFLTSISNKGSIIYVQTNNLHKNMRLVVSEEYAKDVLNALPKLETIYNPNDKLRDKEYVEIINSCDFLTCFKAFKGLYLEKSRRVESGLKLNQLDEKNYKKLESSIISELSVIYNKTTDQIKKMLIDSGLDVL